jgi:putative FmdB family regulatory protein
MPIYEYRCESCRRYHQQLVLSLATYQVPACPRCGQPALKKMVSKFAFRRSEESRLEDLADPSSFGDLDENDPRSVARWARKMGDTLGEDLGPEFDEMVDRMEAGEMPDDEGGGIGEGAGGEMGIGDDVGSAMGAGDD